MKTLFSWRNVTLEINPSIMLLTFCKAPLKIFLFLLLKHISMHRDAPCKISETYAPYSSAMTITMSSAHSPSFPSLHLRHSSFSNPSLDLPTSQLILQPFRCFTYVRAPFPTLLSLLLRHRIFTYVTWRAAHDIDE